MKKLIVVIFVVLGTVGALLLNGVNASSNDGDQQIVVVVPATTIIWIDENGYITKTESNSPNGGFQPGDQLYVFGPNGVIVQPSGTAP